jgi:hypothetical protein
MKAHPERTRLLKQDPAKLAEALQHQLGSDFMVEVTKTGMAIYVYRKEDLVASFRWVKGIGWQPFVIQPFVFCLDDVEHTAEEIRRSVLGKYETYKKWTAFLLSKSEKLWKAYQGAHAAHYFRMYRDPSQKAQETP